MFSTREVAKLLRVPEARLQDLLRREKIAEPQRIGGRRAWTSEEVEAARKVVKEHA